MNREIDRNHWMKVKNRCTVKPDIPVGTIIFAYLFLFDIRFTPVINLVTLRTTFRQTDYPWRLQALIIESVTRSPIIRFTIRRRYLYRDARNKLVADPACTIRERYDNKRLFAGATHGCHAATMQLARATSLCLIFLIRLKDCRDSLISSNNCRATSARYRR